MSKKRKSGKRETVIIHGTVYDSAILMAAAQKGLAISVHGMDIGGIPSAPTTPSEPPMTPEQEKTEKLYANIATNIWRIKNQILDEEHKGEGVLKDKLDERAIAKISRYINSLETAMANGGIEVVGDYEGKPHREGSAVKVVSYEDRQDLKEDTYIEVLMPTVRWTNAEGKTRLLQPAEVVIGRPKTTNA